MIVTHELRKELGSKRGAVKHLIYHELGRNNMNGPMLAEKLGCSNANVSNTILGYNHSKLVLDGLRAAGVPEKYLFDPRRCKAQKKQEVA